MLKFKNKLNTHIFIKLLLHIFMYVHKYKRLSHNNNNNNLFKKRKFFLEKHSKTQPSRNIHITLK
jgi:hypothetical protein